MKNPGLSAFAAPIATLTRPADPMEDDPEGGESDYVRPVSFGRWRTPGQTVHVPIHQGPSFGHGESPEDIIHGEFVSPEEQDSADKILNGEHESDSASENPYVEKAREDLHTPDSDVAIRTLSGLLSGAHPSSMSQQDMDAAHAWLSHRFTGVRVNPNHGVLEAASPAGSQLVKRHVHLPAIPEHAEAPPTYSLVNKHGTFESDDAQRLVRTMVAFQIVHNEILQQRKKKDDDDQDNGSLTSTSGLLDWLGKGISGPPPNPKPQIPPSAVFEPGAGIDKDHQGRLGGYVMDAGLAPLGWWEHEGTAYSPGHQMRVMLDPKEAIKPRNDPMFGGHTFTYAPNADTGHTVPRIHGGLSYYVQDKIHPAARGAGFDLPPVPKPPKAPKVVTKRPARIPKKGPTPPAHKPPLSLPPATSAAKDNDLCPVCASGYLEPYDREFHECLNCGSLVKHVGFDKESSRKPPRGRGGLGRGLTGLDAIPEQVGDPLNLAAGGSEDPDYVVDEEGHVHPLADEELDPDYVGYEAPRSILGGYTSALVNKLVDQYDNLRFFYDTDFPVPKDENGVNFSNQPMISLKRIHDGYDYDWDGESENSPGEMCETCHLRGTGVVKPEEHDSVSSHQFKPIQDSQRFSAVEADPLDEHMGKLGLQPHHKPGQSRLYMMPMTGTPGGYLRLTEGVPTHAGAPSGWALTADHIIPRSDQWTTGRVPQRHILLDRSTNKPGQSQFKQPLPDPGERQMAQKTFLASGSHPVDDPVLYHAIRDMAENGRNAKTYWNAFNGTAYEPPNPRPTGTTQRELRGLSSVGNPGLTRFASVS